MGIAVERLGLLHAHNTVASVILDLSNTGFMPSTTGAVISSRADRFAIGSNPKTRNVFLGTNRPRVVHYRTTNDLFRIVTLFFFAREETQK
jgi:hypothetical protein